MFFTIVENTDALSFPMKSYWHLLCMSSCNRSTLKIC